MSGDSKETAIRCEKPYGVRKLPGYTRCGDRIVTVWRGEMSGTEYMQIAGENGEDWFRIKRTS